LWRRNSTNSVKETPLFFASFNSLAFKARGSLIHSWVLSGAGWFGISAAKVMGALHPVKQQNKLFCFFIMHHSSLKRFTIINTAQH
tara:strand:- start:213 stop:470 length:258 start_codon:yes stop_codon:yes gene_type:complete